MNDRPSPPGRLAARRGFLKALGATALVPVVGAGAVTAAVPGWEMLGAAPAVVAGPGGIFLVNGWVLTRADLDALGLRAA